MTKTCFGVALLFALLSCKKDELNDEKSLLSGNWEWLYTQHTYGWCEGSAFYEIINPEITGKTYTVSCFDSGKIVFYNNGIKEKKYRIVFEYFIKLDESTYAFQLKLDNDVSKVIEGIVTQDTLNIKYPYVEQEPNCENYLNFFVRE